LKHDRRLVDGGEQFALLRVERREFVAIFAQLLLHDFNGFSVVADSYFFFNACGSSVDVCVCACEITIRRLL
jgi:hypothetical protein